MRRALQLAQNGIGTCRPNPSVGAVVVYENKIIGEGFTSEYGGAHGEVNAINSVCDKSLLKEATIYVTLEPCSHFGKTPPCADMLVSVGIRNVVIGCIDDNDLVAGKGVARLELAGVNVKVGFLEAECKRQHRRFFIYQNKKRPYIVLKWAQTQDGFVAPLTKTEKKPVWISSIYSQQLAHKLRAKEHAILVGTNTVLDDNPSLNVRSWGGNHPIRIVLDRKLRLPLDSKVFSCEEQKTIVLTEQKKESSKSLIYERIDFTKALGKQICAVLFRYNIQSLIVEGGAKTISTFIDENLWDEAYVFRGKSMFGEGVSAPCLGSYESKETHVGDDVLSVFYNM